MRQALGRGLEALIPAEKHPQAEPEHKHRGEGFVQKIPINRIKPNRLQPRKSFDAEKLSGLAQSIKEHGLAQPIIVSPTSEADSYELIAGERRLRAAELAGLTEIDAVVRVPEDDKRRLALALIENLQREDLNPIEEAMGYLRLMKDFSMTQAGLCDSLGKSKSAVSNTLRLLNLPDEIQRGLQNNQISEGHARALLAIQNPLEMIELFRTIVSQNLSVRDVEERVRRDQEKGGVAKKASGPRAKQKSSDILALESSLQHHLGTRVDIKIGKEPYEGSLTIHFFSLTDFDKIISKLKK